jgi:hypothetical protein
MERELAEIPDTLQLRQRRMAELRDELKDLECEMEG